MEFKQFTIKQPLCWVKCTNYVIINKRYIDVWKAISLSWQSVFGSLSIDLNCECTGFLHFIFFSMLLGYPILATHGQNYYCGSFDCYILLLNDWSYLLWIISYSNKMVLSGSCWFYSCIDWEFDKLKLSVSIMNILIHCELAGNQLSGAIPSSVFNTKMINLQTL